MGHSESPFHKPRHGAYVRSRRWLTGALPSKAAAASWSLTFLTSIGVGPKDATTLYYSCGALSKKKGYSGQGGRSPQVLKASAPQVGTTDARAARAIFPGAKTTFEPPASRRGAWWLL